MARAAKKKTIVTVSKKVTPKKEKTLVSSQFRWGESYVSLLLGILVVVLAAGLFVFMAKHKRVQETSSTRTVASFAQKPTLSPADMTVSPAASSSPTVSLTPVPAMKKIAVITKTLVVTSTPTVTLAVPTKTVYQAPAMQQKGEVSRIQQKMYMVQHGDSLWSIAEKEYSNGYMWTAIAKANNLSDPGAIFSGNQLVLPTAIPSIGMVTPTPTIPSQLAKLLSPSPMPKRVVMPSESMIPGTYIVQKGDDLWGIAVKVYNNGYRWVDIARANSLSNPGLIYSGNVLKLPKQ